MKRFMEENVITHNLMSFSGFKGLLVFTLLVEKPCSYKEIQDVFKNNEYLHETISKDTIRIYMNSLKEIGCEIETIKEGKFSKYYIKNHPFELKISDKQIKSILKVYKAIAKSIDISDFVALQSFFEKIAGLIANDELKQKLMKLSPTHNINPELIKDLRELAKNNSEITILYNSANTKMKNIDILINKMYILNGKLYIAGINSEYNNYSSFLVSRIKKIVSVNMKSTLQNIPKLTVQYEIYNEDNVKFEILENEKIISEDGKKMIIEIQSENRFMIKQRVLSSADRCKVISPKDFQAEIIRTLKEMQEEYLKNG